MNVRQLHLEMKEIQVYLIYYPLILNIVLHCDFMCNSFSLSSFHLSSYT